MRDRGLRLARISALGLFLAGGLDAQPVLDITQELAFDRPESWAMKYFSAVNLLTGFGPPRALEPGSIELGAELAQVPSLSEAERTVGFDGTKTEDLDKTSIFARPRVLVGLPAKLSLEATYLPPVDLFGVEPHLLAAALGRPLLERRGGRLGLRVFAQYGTIEGDLTCPAEEAAAGSDLTRNPFRCEAASSDELTIRAAGLELSGSLLLGAAERVEPHLAIALSRFDPEFRVDARYSGIIDRTRLVTEGSNLAVTAGVTYLATRRLRATIEAFYSPLEVVRPPARRAATETLLNFRSLVSYRIR